MVVGIHEKTFHHLPLLRKPARSGRKENKQACSTQTSTQTFSSTQTVYWWGDSREHGAQSIHQLCVPPSIIEPRLPPSLIKSCLPPFLIKSCLPPSLIQPPCPLLIPQLQILLSKMLNSRFFAIFLWISPRCRDCKWYFAKKQMSRFPLYKI